MKNLLRYLLILVFIAGINKAEGQGQVCLLSTHPYYQPVNITNGGGALTDYQIKLTVNTSSLVSGGKMLSNGNDIRFTTSNCTNIEYWIESGMNTAATSIWIKVPSVPAGSSTIYMYYGHSSAALASNSSNVFDFIDDFTGSTLNTSKWTQAATGATTTVSGGTIALSTTSTNNILTVPTFSTNEICEMNVTAISGYWPHIGQFTSSSPGNGVCLLYASLYGNVISGEMPNQSDAYGANFYQFLSPGTLTGVWSLAWPSTNNMIYSWPGGSGSYTSTPTKPSSIRGTFGCLSSGTGSITVDWYRMRKYAASPPSAVMGSEFNNYNIDITSVNQSSGSSSFCGGGSFGIIHKIVGTWTANLFLYLELSDASGSFSAPTSISTISGGGTTWNTTINWGTTTWLLPNNLPYGTGYRLRLRSTNPGFNGNPSAAFTIGATPTSTNFTIDKAAQCNETDMFTFTASGSIATGNNLSRDWNYGDGYTGSGSPVSHGYANDGTYNVNLKAYNKDLPKCSADVVKQVIVHPQPVANGFISSWGGPCEGADYYYEGSGSYVNTGYLSSYDWNFGDNTTSNNYNGYKAWSTFGYYKVKLVVTSDQGCKDTFTIDSVAVNPKPKVNFTTGLACDKSDVQFYDASTVNNFNGSQIKTGGFSFYRFNDGTIYDFNTNPKHLFSAPGTYSVYREVQTNKGCIDTIRKNVVVNPKPLAKFTATNSCLTSNVAITNSSSISSGSLTYKWDLGDGTFSNATTPSPLYNTAGSYNIRLTAIAGTGCTDSAEKKVVVYGMPTANFAATTECEGTATEFTNYSTDVKNVLWTFEPGQTSTNTNPSYTYGSDGTYTVVLEIESPNGCKASIKKDVTVNPNPVADFSVNASSQCLTGNSFLFNNLSSINSGSYSSTWEFGDNTVSSDEDPTKTYAFDGDYTVNLWNTSDQGCLSKVVSKTITVDPMPVIKFSFNNSCQNTAVQFLNSSTVSKGSFGNFTWKFGDNTQSNVANPAHTYTAAGSYTVTLDGTTDKGCKGNASATYVAWPNPTVGFTSDNVCFGLTNKFTNTSSVSSGFMAAYDWNFGDATTSAEINPSHMYGSAGTYNVTLKGTTDKGCFSTANGSASVWPQPKADFTVTNVCQGLASVFTNNSTINGGSINSNDWTFGDGGTSTVANPTHTYNKYGNYTASLTVKSDKNCSSSISKTAQVYRQPVAKIYSSNLKPSVLEPEVMFNDISLFGDFSKWDFGFNGRTSTNNTDTCTYTKPGKFTVQLVSSTVDQCTDTTTVEVDVANGYTIYFPNAFTPNGDQLNDKFGAVGIFTGIVKYNLYILDTKGRVVFETENINAKWDGSLQNLGEPVPPGNYAWFATYKDFNGKDHAENGVISIRK